MKAEEKKQIYNLIKTISQGIYGYTPDAFTHEDPVFKDDFISEGLNKKTSPITENQTTINSIPHEETKKIVSLAAISSKIQACTRCRLAATRTNTVPGTGVEKPLVLVIGEGPGYEEDQQALPFVGAAGELLDKMLASICLSRNQNCYIANIVKCRPPQNRDPQPDEIQACISYLDAQITLLKPKMILLMGRIAGQTIFKTNRGISSFRGEIINYNGIPAMATYHPSALLRNTELKAPAWEDLKKFRAELLKIDPDYQHSFVKE